MINKIKKVKLLVMDVDGVLTDGKIIYDGDGKEIKVFNVQDGYGLVLFQKMGLKTAILSARSAPAVTTRMKDLKITKIYQDAYPKMGTYKKILKELKVKEDEVCFVGDDLPDLPVLKRVGFAVAVKNAAPELKRHADYVTRKKGGQGAVREVVELILKKKGLWRKIIATYI